MTTMAARRCAYLAMSKHKGIGYVCAILFLLSFLFLYQFTVHTSGGVLTHMSVLSSPRGQQRKSQQTTPHNQHNLHHQTGGTPSRQTLNTKILPANHNEKHANGSQQRQPSPPSSSSSSSSSLLLLSKSSASSPSSSLPSKSLPSNSSSSSSTSSSWNTKQCELTRNIAFVKTHKAGSSTVANILQRFGLAHHLTFALPNKVINSPAFNYIVKYGQYFSRQKLLPLPEGRHEYNILWCHSIYDKAAFRKVMPADTAYFSILREPFQQFISTFEYYGFVKRVKLAPGSLQNPESVFLKSPQSLKFKPSNYSYLRNKQAQDLGFGDEEFKDVSKMRDYITQLDKDFSTIMIMEHFDESLLILKRKLCWGLKDIIYIPKNKNEHKPKRIFTDLDREAHKQFSALDYDLYDHFLEKFKRQLESQPVDFAEELAYFKSVLALVREFCPKHMSISVPMSKWTAAFDVTREDCNLMLISEIDGLRYLLKVQK